MQSYPVFALPLGALVQRVKHTKWKPVFYSVGVYLLGVNLFQTWQYDRTILHFNDMNRAYYRAIYLNAHPSPEDMSLLDNNDRLKNEKAYRQSIIAHCTDTIAVHFSANEQQTLLDTILSANDREWLKIEALIKAPNGYWGGHLKADFSNGDSTLTREVRLFNAISPSDSLNRYAFYVKLPEADKQSKLKVYLTSGGEFNGIVTEYGVTSLRKKD